MQKHQGAPYTGQTNTFGRGHSGSTLKQKSGAAAPISQSMKKTVHQGETMKGSGSGSHQGSPMSGGTAGFAKGSGARPRPGKNSGLNQGRSTSY